MTARGCRGVLAILLSSIATPWTAGQAQKLQLLVREEGSLAPVGGAIVRLLRGDSVIAQALTAENGRTTLHSASGGPHDLRVDRIGFAGTRIRGVVLAATGTTPFDVIVPAIRLVLPTLVVEGASRCGALRDSGLGVAALWEEIRKALDASVLTLEHGETPLHTRNFRRETSLDGTPVRRWFTRSAVEQGPPFTAPPVTELLAAGFARVFGGHATLHGPDAHLLLDDNFVAAHCYRLARSSDGLLGLTFEPVATVDITGIRGTLWVDSASSELRRLEFAYVNPPPELRSPQLGGRIDFTRLPSGLWIISEWYIRAPRIGTAPGTRPGAGQRVLGYLDMGGLAAPAGAGSHGSSWAILEGVVTDSLAGAGLPGAVVTVAATGDSVLTDSSGRFRLVVTGSGDHRVQVRHPRLGLLDDPTERIVLLSIGETSTADFGVPPLTRFVTHLCGPRAALAAVVGRVDDAAGRGQLTPHVEYWEGPLTGRTVARQHRLSATGLFGLCGATTGRELTIRLYRGLSPLDESRVILQPGEHRWVELVAPRSSPPPRP